MKKTSIYNDIAKRTDGDIYVGVVGPVRTGKSTFIKRFMDTLVIPNIDNAGQHDRAVDELPQSSAGRTIMTTEPKFIPENAVEINLPDNASFKVRMIDCVGYIVPSSLGYIEGDGPRMVHTPWAEDEMPFDKAAEIGTRKVIAEHSTIGLVITTDGSISEIPRSEYEEAEGRVISELKGLKKPFVVLLNSTNPESDEVKNMAASLTDKYGVPVMPVNCLEIGEEEIKEILTQVLFEFPVKEVSVGLPGWAMTLSRDHWLRSGLCSAVSEAAQNLRTLRDVKHLAEDICACEYVTGAKIAKMDLSCGAARIEAQIDGSLFYKILAEETGLDISGEQDLMSCMRELAAVRREYERLKGALDEVEATGYGIVMPSLDELSLEEPEIMRQGGQIRRCACAPPLRSDTHDEGEYNNRGRADSRLGVPVQKKTSSSTICSRSSRRTRQRYGSRISSASLCMSSSTRDCTTSSPRCPWMHA